MSEKIFSEEELKTLKSYLDDESESQNDIWSSETFDYKDECGDDEIVKRSVIIWATPRYSECGEEKNQYWIKIEYRYMDKDDYGCYDETIETFEVYLGDSKDDIDTLEDAINCFIEHGGKRSDLEYLVN